MWENAYLSIKNPKASRALNPGRKLLTLLSASEAGPPDQILDPHLVYRPLQLPGVVCPEGVHPPP